MNRAGEWPATRMAGIVPIPNPRYDYIDIHPRKATMPIPKYKKLKRFLLDDIDKREPGEALPTVASLRQKFAISQATVERALNELRSEGRIHSRRGSGIYVADRARFRQIALMVPYDIFDPRRSEFARLLLHGLQGQASTRRTLLRHYIPSGADWGWEYNYKQLQTDVANKQIDGLIAVEMWDADGLDWPVPAVGMEWLPSIRHQVRTDRLAVIRQGVAALVGRGCRRIALIADRNDPYHSEQRAAFQQALAEHGARTEPGWTLGVDADRADKYEVLGADFARGLWQTASPPDALLSVDDHATSGAIAACAELGLQPARDLHIATLANRRSRILADQPVIRLEFDPDRIAAALLDLLDAVTAGDAPPTPISIQPTTIDVED